MSEPQNKLPRGDSRVTGARLSQDPNAPHQPVSAGTPPLEGATRLKIVTISPGRASFADTEMPSAQQRALRQDPYLGATIDGRYKVEAVLGEGGMGVVYRCTHTIIGKKVAMKVLRADLARDVEVTERFLNEAKAASAIGNPHIIDISDFGQFPDGSTYFIMEYLGGTPLSKALEGGQPVPVARIVHIAHQLAEGLAAAHTSGIVHRDLKPDNIFLIDRGAQRDFVKILDFGIAKVSSTSAGKLTRAGAVFGTPHYMSPEQAAGAPVDHRGDIYSLGVILYEMASGRVPFDADNFMGILTQHMYKAPVPIRALVPEPQEVPPGLEAIVLKCLSKRPDDRFQTMEELVVDLDRLKDGYVPGAVNEMMARSGGFNVPADYFNKGMMPAPKPATPEGVPTKSRWPLYAGIAGVLAAVGIVAAIFAKSASSDAFTTRTGNALVVPPLKPEATPSIATTPAAPNAKEVVVAAEPLDAHVFQGDTDLGTSPVMLEVKEGERIELRIRREGFKEGVISVDGANPRQVVRLERVVTPGPFRPAPARPKAPPTKPGGTKKKGGIGGEIVDPWN